MERFSPGILLSLSSNTGPLFCRTDIELSNTTLHISITEPDVPLRIRFPPGRPSNYDESDASWEADDVFAQESVS